MKRESNQNLSGNEVYNTNSSMLLKNMLCSKLDCQKVFNLIIFLQVRLAPRRLRRLSSTSHHSRIKWSFSTALMCTKSRRVPVNASTNQGFTKFGLISVACPPTRRPWRQLRRKSHLSLGAICRCDLPVSCLQGGHLAAREGAPAHIPAQLLRFTEHNKTLGKEFQYKTFWQ